MNSKFNQKKIKLISFKKKINEYVDVYNIYQRVEVYE